MNRRGGRQARRFPNAGQPTGFTPKSLPGLVLWLRADLGVSIAQGPVVATGTTPPTVTMTGTPASSTQTIVVTITLIGTLGIATYSAAVNGSTVQTGTTAASVPLTGTGITIGFGAGTYALNDTYKSVVVVSAWADQSGTGDSNKNATQATATKQTSYNAGDAAYGTKATLSFASPQNLLTGTWATPLTQPSTVIVVGQSAATAQYFCDGLDSTHRTAILINASFVSSDAGTILASTSGIPTTPTVIACTYNGASSKIYVNSSAASVGSGNVGANQANGLAIGSSNIPSSYLNGKIAEVVAYEGALSQAQVAQLFAYAGARYGQAWS